MLWIWLYYLNIVNKIKYLRSVSTSLKSWENSALEMWPLLSASMWSKILSSRDMVEVNRCRGDRSRPETDAAGQYSRKLHIGRFWWLNKKQYIFPFQLYNHCQRLSNSRLAISLNWSEIANHIQLKFNKSLNSQQWKQNTVTSICFQSRKVP